MNYHNQICKKNAGRAIALCGSVLLGIAGFARAGAAEQMGDPNSPNSSACTPMSQAETSAMPAQPNVIPLPRQRSTPVARVIPVNGRLQINLTNETGDPVTYQVIGDTRPRIIPEKSQVSLLDLQAPITVTFQRPNGALLRVDTRTNLEANILEVTLTETTNLGTDKNALMVEDSGLVFVN